MADDPIKDKKGEGDAGDGGEGKGKGGGEGDSPFKSLMSEKGFKTEEDAVKYIKDLDEKVGKTASERDQYQKYYPYALAFSSYLKSNPKAMEEYKKWSGGQDGGNGDGDGGDDGDDGDGGEGDGKGKKVLSPKDDAARKDISELMSLEKDRIVQSFDQKFGLSKLSDDDYNRAAGAMGATLRSWGVDLRSPTVEMLKRLPRALEDAYALTKIQDAKSEGKLEGLLQFQRDQQGRIPSIPSVEIDNPDEITESTLSEKEKVVAKKMKLTPKEYAEQKKKILQEKK